MLKINKEKARRYYTESQIKEHERMLERSEKRDEKFCEEHGLVKTILEDGTEWYEKQSNRPIRHDVETKTKSNTSFLKRNTDEAKTDGE